MHLSSGNYLKTGSDCVSFSNPCMYTLRGPLSFTQQKPWVPCTDGDLKLQGKKEATLQTYDSAQFLLCFQLPPHRPRLP